MARKKADDKPTPISAAVQATEGEQAEAFPGGPATPPPDWVNPPGNDVFDNVTHMRAGPDITKIVDDVMGMEEFKGLDAFPFVTVWRKRTKPTTSDGVPIFASTEIAPLLWRFLSEGALGFAINLHWAHFDELREESNWVHPDTLAQHLHHALMYLEITEEGTLRRRQPTVQVWPQTIERFGAFTPTLATLQAKFAGWPTADEG